MGSKNSITYSIEACRDNLMDLCSILGNADDCWYTSSEIKHPTTFRTKSTGNGKRLKSFSSAIGYLCDLLVLAVDVGGVIPVVVLHNLQMTSKRDISPSFPNKRKYAMISRSRIEPCEDNINVKEQM